MQFAMSVKSLSPEEIENLIKKYENSATLVIVKVKILNSADILCNNSL